MAVFTDYRTTNILVSCTGTDIETPLKSIILPLFQQTINVSNMTDLCEKGTQTTFLHAGELLALYTAVQEHHQTDLFSLTWVAR